MPYVYVNVSRRTVKIGDRVTVSCWGFGYPRPTMTLSMPNGSVYNFVLPHEFKSNVQIGNSAKEGGVYNCLSTNEFGTKQSNTTVNGERYLLMNVTM